MPIQRRAGQNLVRQVVEHGEDIVISSSKGAGTGAASNKRTIEYAQAGKDNYVAPSQATKDARSTAAPIEDAVAGAKAPQDWAGYTEPGNWFTGALDRGGIGGLLAMGTIGGTASLATGGEFLQGAGVGIGFGYAARGIHRNMTTQLGGKGSAMFGESGKLAQRAASEEGGFGGMMAGAALKMGPSVQTIQARHAMMAGAGLFGAMGGGNRKNNHRRGFNAHRGNTF